MGSSESAAQKASPVLRIIGDGEHAEVVREAALEGRGGDFIGIGDPGTRQRVASELPLAEWSTVVHPRAIVSPDATLRPGVFVAAGAVINRGAVIGHHAIVNTGAIVEHDVKVAEFVNIGPGVVIGGGARIGNLVTLGLGCRIRDHVTVGHRSMVGMGAVVVSDVPDGVTVMGCPARIVPCST